MTHPDLIVQFADAPASIVAGSTVLLQWTTTNVGSGTASVSWVERLYLSIDQQPSADDALLAARQVTDALPAGNSQMREQSVSIPHDIAGPYYLFAVVDAGDDLRELDGEANNWHAVPLTIELAPYAIGYQRRRCSGVDDPVIRPRRHCLTITNQGNGRQNIGLD